jgi:hypothetical protein
MYGNLEVNANKIEFERCGIPPLRKVCPLFVLTESNSKLALKTDINECIDFEYQAPCV